MPVNTELLKRVVNHIIEHPETWDQRRWHCGTSHCVAGHCQIMAGKPPTDEGAADDAREALGLDWDDAAWLFAPERTLPEIHGFAKAVLAGEAGYNHADYDRDGYNRDGYNRLGYDRRGYDRAGYDRDGYNRLGYDRNGSKLPLL